MSKHQRVVGVLENVDCDKILTAIKLINENVTLCYQNDDDEVYTNWNTEKSDNVTTGGVVVTLDKDGVITKLTFDDTAYTADDFQNDLHASCNVKAKEECDTVAGISIPK